MHAHAFGVSPYGAQVGLGQPFGLPSAVVSANPMLPPPSHQTILSSNPVPLNATTVPGFGSFGWAPTPIMPAAATAGTYATSYFPYAAPQAYAYAGYPPSVPVGYAPQYAYPYTAAYLPPPITSMVPAWPYGAMSPVATTAGPFAGAAVQTSTVQAPVERKIAPDVISATSATSPVETKTLSNGNGSGSDTNGHQPSDQTSNSPSADSFNVQNSNRAIGENRQLIVKFLTDDTTEQQFRDLFERFGPVQNARIIYDKKTNHTKGFGFITYQRAEDAVQALRTMGGYQLHGRQLNVALAQTERKRAFAAGEFHPTPASASGQSD